MDSKIAKYAFQNGYASIITRHLLCVFSALSLCLAHPLVHAKEHSRIISAGGSITEIIHALGLFDRLVAVDSSSLYPQQASTLPQVGYFRALGAEGLLSLNPDLIVAARGAGPTVVLDQARDLGVEVKLFEQSVYTLDSWRLLIEEVGNFFERTEQASILVQGVQHELHQIAKNRRYLVDDVNAVVLLSLGQRGPIAAGKNTVPDLLFNLAGVHNLASELEGFKPFSTELIAKQRLDLIIVPAHVAQSMGGKEAICKNQAIALATTQGCNVHVMDGLLLLGFGSRIHIAVKEVMNQANLVTSRLSQ